MNISAFEQIIPAPAVGDSGRQQVNLGNASSRGVLTSMQGRPAFEVWTRQQWIALASHLHNNNSPNWWVMGMFAPNVKNGGRPETQYKRSKTVHVVRGIGWAWSSICGKGRMKIAFTPYSQNEKEHSRWAAVDFDAHSEDPKENQEAFGRALAFFIAILDEDGIHIILEASGRGWHVFLIAKEFRSITWWVDLMTEKLKETGLYDHIGKGVIEIFPRVSVHENECGFAIRAPGSWHPERNEVNLVLWENVGALADALVSLNIANRKAVSRKRKKYVSLAPSLSNVETPFLYPRLLGLLDDFAITLPQTRNKRLGKLVGELFHQVGADMAERFIVEQYEKKQISTDASKQDHLEEFGEMWAGLHRHWLGSLNKSEAAVIDGMDSETDCDAFRIIRSYAMHASKHGHPDFAIGRDDLAARLGMTGMGAGKLRQRFTVSGIIKQVRQYVPHKFAARYAWKLEGQS